MLRKTQRPESFARNTLTPNIKMSEVQRALIDIKLSVDQRAKEQRDEMSAAMGLLQLNVDKYKDYYPQSRLFWHGLKSLAMMRLKDQDIKDQLSKEIPTQLIERADDVQKRMRLFQTFVCILGKVNTEKLYSIFNGMCFKILVSVIINRGLATKDDLKAWFSNKPCKHLWQAQVCVQEHLDNEELVVAFWKQVRAWFRTKINNN